MFPARFCVCSMIFFLAGFFGTNFGSPVLFTNFLLPGCCYLVFQLSQLATADVLKTRLGKGVVRDVIGSLIPGD